MPPHINWFFLSSLSLCITTFFLVIILLKYSREKIHKIWTLFNFSIFIWALNATLISITPNKELSLILWKIGILGVTFTSPFITHVFHLLIDQKIKKMVFISYLFASFFSCLTPTDLILSPTTHLNYFHGYYVGTMGKLYWVWFCFWFLSIQFSQIHLIKFYFSKNLKKEEKREIGYFVLSTAIAFYIGLLTFFIHRKWPIAEFGNFGIVFYCLIATYAIFQHQLFNIKIVYQKGLLYSLLITTLTSIYLLIVFIAEWLFRGVVGYHSIFISILSAFIISLIFNPLRNKLQVIVDKIFLGKTSHEFAQENILLKQELERSERLKTASTLALGLAHEIRNPLTTIKTFADFLPEKLNDKEFLAKFSKLVPGEVERINHIIQQLLNFAKPSAPAFKEINIHELIKGTLEFLNSEFLKKKIQVSEYYEDSTITLKADSSQIRQVLVNLLFNALDAMPSGGKIDIKTKINNEYFEIQIADTGCGIAKKDTEHIFDPFFTTKDKGSGLGLSICSQIIKNHCGKIEVESEINRGTTFTICLPLLSAT